jgi:hypothetical protein
VPAIRLHDARHTCGTLMHMQGDTDVVISQWLSHADPFWIGIARTARGKRCENGEPSDANAGGRRC